MNNEVPKEISEYMSKIGKKGGSSKSPLKLAKAAENAKKGGRKKGWRKVKTDLKNTLIEENNIK